MGKQSRIDGGRGLRGALGYPIGCAGLFRDGYADACHFTCEKAPV